jgi:hypothetical protein
MAGLEDVDFDPEAGGGIGGSNTTDGNFTSEGSTSENLDNNPFQFMAQMCVNNPRPLVVFLVGKMGTGKSSLGESFVCVCSCYAMLITTLHSQL